jgi:hypothetical protein
LAYRGGVNILANGDSADWHRCGLVCAILPMAGAILSTGKAQPLPMSNSWKARSTQKDRPEFDDNAEHRPN